MRIYMLVAVDKQNGIAQNGQIPWYIPQDLKLFKQRTMGKMVVVGRKTWESFKSPLEGRRVVVLTTQNDYVSPKPVYAIAHSLEEALEAAQNEEEVFVIGGEEIYKLFLSVTERVYLTRVSAHVTCDQFFPFLESDKWEVREDDSGATFTQDFYVVVYVRK